MSYTLDPHCVFNWYQLIFSCLYTHLCFSIYVCFNFQIVSISIGIYFFIHIYVFCLCLLYLYILKHKFCCAKLDLVFNDNYFSIGISYKLMHYFYWYFIKGRKFIFYLSIGIFQSIFFSIDILLLFFMMKNTLFWYMLTFSILVSCFILNWYLY